jgi:hypothetical protein
MMAFVWGGDYLLQGSEPIVPSAVDWLPDHTNGMGVVIAPSLSDAREAVRVAYGEDSKEYRCCLARPRWFTIRDGRTLIFSVSGGA